MIILLLFLLILSCAPKEQKLVGVNYIDIILVDGRISISYHSENPLKPPAEGKPAKRRLPVCKRGRASWAIWVWNPRRLKDRFPEFKEIVREFGIGRVYLQISRGLTEDLINDLKNLGLEVFLLEGARDSKVKVDFSLINNLPVEGLQLDLEPYTREDFRLKRERYLGEYINFLKEVKRKLGKKKLSVVIPFWYEKLRLKGKPLLRYVFRYADEVVVMAYRSDFREALSLSWEEIKLGRKYGKDVWIGFELFPLKDEVHHVYKVGKFKLEPIGTYRVRGERLTMKRENLKKLRWIRCEGVKGFVIHSFEAL